MLGRSWNFPAELKMSGKTFASKGYDKNQRVYVLTKRSNAPTMANLEFELAASDRSPVLNPGLVVKNWGSAGVKLLLNGTEVLRGKDFRFGHHRTLEGTDLIVWIKAESTRPVKVVLEQVRVYDNFSRGTRESLADALRDPRVEVFPLLELSVSDLQIQYHAGGLRGKPVFQ